MEITLKEAMTATEAHYAPMIADIFNGYGVEVTLPDPDAFLKVKETLTRVGIQRDNATLDQPCYILHKRGRYAIVHFLELVQMDGENVDPTEVDDALAVRNTVAGLLDQWGLVSVVDDHQVQAPRAPVKALRIVPHKMKSQWNLNPLYMIGRRSPK